MSSASRPTPPVADVIPAGHACAGRDAVYHQIDRLLCPSAEPFAVLYRPHVDPDAVQVLFGDLLVLDRLAQLPAPAGPDLPVLAVVPFRQIRERGFDVVDDGVPLLALRVDQSLRIGLDVLLDRLPAGPDTFTETGYDVPDAEYERTVRVVLDDEIAAGSGSNFVIHRCLTGRLDPAVEPPARAALGAMARLLVAERQAYWTFVVHTPHGTFVGATPERHVSLDAGVARMNPISGTLRYPPGGWSGPEARREAVLEFLADPKERDELAMVVDEELKMMAVVGDHGGRVRGPYLKEMSHLAHTEYVIEGLTSFDAKQVLAATMFAPTVTGSPLRNACRVIARHERRGRRYYGGVLALIGQDAQGRPTLDSPILIRTAEIAPDGTVRVPAGATLVRGSTPASELAETRAKAAGIVAALTSRPSTGTRAGGDGSAGTAGGVELAELAGDARVRAVLVARNRTLARFWLEEQPFRTSGTTAVSGRAGRDGLRIAVVEAEDDFTGMLAHVLERLGHGVTVVPWNRPGDLDAADLVLFGPGPGDPNDTGDERIAALQARVRARLATGAPVAGICLGHQLLSIALGLAVERLARPDQGRQVEIDLFGRRATVGFYNSFGVRPPPAGYRPPVPGLAVALDRAGRQVLAVRARTVSGMQFHPESVLTTDGLGLLDTQLARLFPPI